MVLTPARGGLEKLAREYEMPTEEIVRVCDKCGTDLPDDAVCVEEGVWWVQAEGRLIVNAPLALGEYATDVLNYLQERGVPGPVITDALLVVAAGRFESAFPSCRGKSIDQCAHVGLPVEPRKDGAA